jgi:MFS family permease
MVLSILWHSLALFFAAIVVAGAANGISLLGGLTLVNAIAPAGRRAQTLTAFFLTGYLSVAVLFPILGWAADRYGLERALFGFAATFIAATIVAFVDLTRWRSALGAQVNVEQLGAVDDLSPEHLHRLLSLPDRERVGG